MYAVLIAAAVIAASAPLPERTPFFVEECRLPDCAMVNGEALKRILDSNESMGTRLKALEAELAALKKAKGCAKLEVTEPPKGAGPVRSL